MASIPPVFDQLPQASFEGTPFPIVNCAITGSIRDHIHIYPHAVGGAPEKMGRNLYLIKMEGYFLTGFKKYPKLWPNSLRTLRGLFENQTTGSLVIPTLGTIQAYCRNWSQTSSAHIRSGEKIDLEFVEDQGAAALTSSLFSISTNNLAQATAAFDATRALSDFSADKTALSLFDQISSLANFVLAFGDLTQVAGNLVQAKIASMLSLVQQLDHMNFVKNYNNEPTISALHDLWDASSTLSQNLFVKRAVPRAYIVPTTMTIGSVSTAIYGDTSHGIELLQLNPIDDASSIPAGTRVKYYVPETSSLGGARNVG